MAVVTVVDRHHAFRAGPPKYGQDDHREHVVTMVNNTTHKKLQLSRLTRFYHASHGVLTVSLTVHCGAVTAGFTVTVTRFASARAY